jgi:hypothetical protein
MQPFVSSLMVATVFQPISSQHQRARSQRHFCEKSGAKSFFDDAREVLPHIPKKQMYQEAMRHVGFLKHADRDPDGALDGFSDKDADMALFVATYDFGSVCAGKSVEAQVFEGWFLTLYGELKDIPTGLDELFPRLRQRPRFDQVALGGTVLRWAKTQPEFKMKYSLEFRQS